MKKWIKVNEYYNGDGSTRLTYINTKKIIAFWRNENNLTKVYFNHDSILAAKETPEEIIKLMEGTEYEGTGCVLGEVNHHSSTISALPARGV